MSNSISNSWSPFKQPSKIEASKLKAKSHLTSKVLNLSSLKVADMFTFCNIEVNKTFCPFGCENAKEIFITASFNAGGINSISPP